MKYESKKVFIIIISMTLGFVFGRAGNLVGFNQNRDAIKNEASKIDRNLIDQIYSMNIILATMIQTKINMSNGH
jgi:hypothetical protein